MDLRNFVAIDFETADNGQDSACAIGLVRVQDARIVDEMVRLICPPRPRMMFTHIHGLKMSDVASQPKFAEHWPEIRKFIEGVDDFVAHNASFDRGVLYACLKAARLEIPTQKFHCTVQIARKVFGIYPTKLSNVCQVLGIELNHHEALSDARASARIVLLAQKKIAESLNASLG
jgi:DNA polymerase-3 subunit epsilon